MKEAREIKSPIVYEAIENLLHDPDNPRLPVRLRGKADDDEAIQWMLRDATLTELMVTIAEVGFFPGEPLLIAPVDVAKPEGPYWVVEGNRRLTAVKLILDPSRAKVFTETVKEISENAINKQDLEFLPVIKYNKREDILNYLGYRHITGVKPWGAFQKAVYLEDLAKHEPYVSMNNDERHLAMARVIGSTSEYVSRLVCGKKLYDFAEQKKLLNEQALNNMQENFTLLTTALYYRDIASFININPRDQELAGLNETDYQYLLNWIYKEVGGNRPVVTESRKLKELSAVVKSPIAITHLKESNDLNGALQIMDATSVADSFRIHLKAAEKALALANNNLDSGDIKEGDLISSDLELVASIDTAITVIAKKSKGLL
ncbi:MAG: hypothetical protein EOO61_00220 [Hymenobacter sp.]|nr:MAG: hypothetical protein EOO61_00220 [Hymenobacter sp.]